MKHIALILILMVLPYAAWQFLSIPQRQQALEFSKRHVVRFVIAAFILFLLFIFAVQTRPFQLF